MLHTEGTKSVSRKQKKHYYQKRKRNGRQDGRSLREKERERERGERERERERERGRERKRIPCSILDFKVYRYGTHR